MSKREKFNPDDSVHRLARSGAMLVHRAPSLGVERVADILDALMRPELYDVIDGRVTRKTTGEVR